MGPVRQNPIQTTVSLFICVCIALCTTVAHNIAPNRPDSFPPYPPDNHRCSDDFYLREGGGLKYPTTVWPSPTGLLRTQNGLSEYCKTPPNTAENITNHCKIMAIAMINAPNPNSSPLPHLNPASLQML